MANSSTFQNTTVLISSGTQGPVGPAGAVISVAGKSGVVVLDKADVGLGSVCNTADSTKAVLSASKLTTARTITITGEASSSPIPFDGSGDISIDVQLNSGMQPRRMSLISAGTDLNDYNSPGFYYQSTDADAASGSNYPEAKAGSLLIFTGASGTTVNQIYIPYAGASADESQQNFWFRGLYNGTWDVWKKMAHSANLKKINGASLFGTGNIDVGGAVNGILKSNGAGGYSAAVDGTDYVTPSRMATANSGTDYTVDLALGSILKLNLTGDCTLTFPSGTAGRSFVLMITQDATGSRTVTWPSSVKWPSSIAPTITSTAGKMDKFGFTHDGSYWIGVVEGENYY